MTEEQIKQKFKETYPDFMRGDEPLSPYFDIWEYGIELATNKLQEELTEKDKEIHNLKVEKNYLVSEKEKQNAELKIQLTEAKSLLKQLLDSTHKYHARCLGCQRYIETLNEQFIVKAEAFISKE